MDSTTAHKAIVIWLGTLYGTAAAMPLSQWVLLATLGYTVLLSAKLIRDWLCSRADRKAAAAAGLPPFALKEPTETK